MKVLIIDNYDSFTYNLVQLVRKTTNKEPVIKRNDAFTLEEIKDFDKILLSPGPGIPSEAGKLLEVIKEYASGKSILGVCLGHQAIAEAFGGTLKCMDTVYHGVATPITLLQKDALFGELPDSFSVGRYHSWVVVRENLPDTLQILSEDEQGNIMSIRHKTLDVRGVQFHPESIMTPLGEQIIYNWINN